MPYTITTKDGIVINNIPDNVKPDDPSLVARVAELRAGRSGRGTPTPGASAPQPAPPPAAPPEATATEIVGQVNRGLGPYAAAALAGAIAGAPAGGVGAVPGALAGMGALAATELLGDPITNGINSLFGTKFAGPGEALAHLRDMIAPPPVSAAGRVTEAAAKQVGGAVGGVGVAKTLMKSAGPVVRGIGTVLAENAPAQIIGAATGGAAGQVAQEAGVGTGGQVAANMAGTMLGGVLAAPRKPAMGRIPSGGVAPSVAAQQAPAEAAQVMERPEVIALVQKASGNGPGASAAKTKLVKLAGEFDTEAMKAAEKLGLDVPADVFASGTQLQKEIGLTRSVPGSPAESNFMRVISDVSKKVDKVLEEAGAIFIDGGPAPAEASRKVRDRLVSTRNQLGTEAKKAFDVVDAGIRRQDLVTMPNLERVLGELASETGGLGATAQEKNLRQILKSRNGTTYGLLRRLKEDAGRAVARGAKWGDGPGGGLEGEALKRVYGAIADDQLNAVETIAGKEARDALYKANGLTKQEIALNKRIVDSFGADVDGSLVYRMKAAISQSAKEQDTKAFASLLKTVPEDLRKEVLATSLASVFRGGEKGVSLNKVAELYPNLRRNREVYAQIVKALGPEADQVLSSVYKVAKNVANAEKFILHTGKALYGAENMLTNILQNAGARAVTLTAASTGSPILTGAASVALDALSKGATPPLVKASKLFSSDAFQNLLTEAATKPKVNPNSVKAVVASPAYQAYAEVAGAPKQPEEAYTWFINAIQGQQVTKKEGKK